MYTTAIRANKSPQGCANILRSLEEEEERWAMKSGLKGDEADFCGGDDCSILSSSSLSDVSLVMKKEMTTTYSVLAYFLIF